ncbi:VOC family protein [Roseibium sp. FZY0029]|uniref:VOC family protein n=1 Tax=Roseibium sp. FZY0029 TaxID=3116647 RepID=UPI002EC0ABFB|nr:VOC family protein [Roseibium sp. FZY0029]
MTDPNTAHGTPSWIEHSSTDTEAARKFYEDVLGWSIGEMPMKDGSTYPMIMVGDKPVGGFPPMPGQGGWLLYITVDDVDARVAKAKSAGAQVVREAVTAPGVGRMAAISDPFGAQIAFIDYSEA